MLDPNKLFVPFDPPDDDTAHHETANERVLLSVPQAPRISGRDGDTRLLCEVPSQFAGFLFDVLDETRDMQPVDESVMEVDA